MEANQTSLAQELLDQLQHAQGPGLLVMAQHQIAQFFDAYLADAGIAPDGMPRITNDNVGFADSQGFRLRMGDGSELIVDPYKDQAVSATLARIDHPDWHQQVMERRQVWAEAALLEPRFVQNRFHQWDYSVGLCHCYTGLAIDIWRKSQGMKYKANVATCDRELNKGPVFMDANFHGVVHVTIIDDEDVKPYPFGNAADYFGLEDDDMWYLTTLNDNGASVKLMNKRMMELPVADQRESQLL